MSNLEGVAPSRILHTMLRVHDLDRSVDFYCGKLGMRELRREEFPDGKFTLVFLGYEREDNGPAIELTYNWGGDAYTHGSGYGHIALEVENALATCDQLARMGVEIARPAGPMKLASSNSTPPEVIAFIRDPDGYLIELIERRGVSDGG